MAELADAADLKSAGLKRLVGVRVPLSAPLTNELSNRITASRLDFGLPYQQVTPIPSLKNIRNSNLSLMYF
jgi:hypothetical protein